MHREDAVVWSLIFFFSESLRQNKFSWTVKARKALEGEMTLLHTARIEREREREGKEPDLRAGFGLCYSAVWGDTSVHDYVLLGEQELVTFL